MPGNRRAAVRSMWFMGVGLYLIENEMLIGVD
jgi:hypothetical protein